MSSATPGANKVSFFILTFTSVPSGKTVSKWPSMATFLLPSYPFIRPSTLPMESIQTLSTPVSLSLLENSINSNGTKLRIINSSVSGDTTIGGLSRITSDLKKHTPDFVLIELGGNDGMRGYPIEEIKNNLVKISKAISAANAVPLIMQIRIPPNYGKRYVTAFENVFSQVAEEQNLTMLTFLLEKVALNKELMQQDGIHPNKAAQPLIADQVKTELLKFIK